MDASTLIWIERDLEIQVHTDETFWVDRITHQIDADWLTVWKKVKDKSSG